jgi:beta-mannanase
VGAADPSGIAAFAAATKTSPTIASDYLPASSGWAGLDGANGSLSWLFADGWSASGYTLSLGVPMIPTDANNNPLGTLAEGATGAYNNYFVTLAQTLVAAGESNAYLRLGWEFDGSWYAWDAATPAAEANYAAYFDQIVTAMRSVSGEAFRFVWNPDASAFVPDQAVDANYNVELAYPGNAYVDVIGLDAYDQSWATPQTPANAWSQSTAPALSAAASFAAQEGKPLSVCEWGVAIRSDGHGLGDDPLYVNNMVAWMSANAISYESYFDYNTLPVGGDTNADITGGSFPNSLAAFIGELG